jgi:hypothetical protein
MIGGIEWHDMAEQLRKAFEAHCGAENMARSVLESTVTEAV